MHSTLIVSLIVISTGFAVASGGSAETLNNNSHQRLVAPEGTLLTGTSWSTVNALLD